MLLSKRKIASRQRRNLVTYSNPDSLIAEQFREIRTNISFVTKKGKKPILLVTSPAEGEGKSTTAANLAVSMASQKENVLLIDANLREPALDYIFKISHSAGLTDVLAGKASLEDAVDRTEIGRLEVLTAGNSPKNPTEILESERMKDLLKDAMTKYDVVLIDSPGVLKVADSRVLANKCDGVILVVSSSSTGHEKAWEAKKALEFAQANIVGVIINEMK
ncbi:CpsD/CapB family tyrosine-protein kinase [Mesobacillus foraminis]|uniref:CpsD/CapB family tyrosine-protein kinase n=1 Tax=Mesobacillus foraminis TaxID=279826 RepID=UPI001BEB9318|nr:CpsD/CapB family tyrosine-protein kinase [Mesobacillus foraminis]MBT2758423.1 CpsD/CapB family tyrosine-protein kinase [Mesobacillus foraminis]